MKWYCILLVILLSSCSEEATDQSKTKDEKAPTTSALVDTIQKGRSEIEKEIIEKAEVLTNKNENSLDSIKSVVKNWNDAINNGGFEKLEGFYTETVRYYLKSISKSELIASKRNWLNKNTGYSQSYEIRAIQYPTYSEEHIIECVFDKYLSYNDGAKLDTVRSILEFRYFEGEYFITKESDQVSEIRSIKQERAQGISEGPHTFDNHRWVDMRDNDALGHNFVPYYTVLTFYIEDTLSVDMYSYSGSLREVRPYMTKNNENA